MMVQSGKPLVVSFKLLRRLFLDSPFPKRFVARTKSCIAEASRTNIVFSDGSDRLRGPPAANLLPRRRKQEQIRMKNFFHCAAFDIP